MKVDLPSWEMELRAGVGPAPLTEVQARARDVARTTLAAAPDWDVVCCTGVFHEAARDVLIDALTAAYPNQVQLAACSEVAWRVQAGIVDDEPQGWTVPLRVLSSAFGIGARPAWGTPDASGLMLFSRVPFGVRVLSWPELGLGRIPAVHFVPFPGPSEDGTAHGCLYAEVVADARATHIVATHGPGLTTLACDVLTSQIGVAPWSVPVVACGDLDPEARTSCRPRGPARR